ncbi:MAG: ABC transporter ATP-binding protein, partial [Thermomicrobiales bacterium]
MRIHGIGTTAKREARIVETLENCGLTPARDFLSRYPHELSGDQSQRIATARAMLLEPDFLVADEPVSMLDVSVRADILNQLLDRRDREGMAIVFITHDLS